MFVSDPFWGAHKFGVDFRSWKTGTAPMTSGGPRVGDPSAASLAECLGLYPHADDPAGLNRPHLL